MHSYRFTSSHLEVLQSLVARRLLSDGSRELCLHPDVRHSLHLAVLAGSGDGRNAHNSRLLHCQLYESTLLSMRHTRLFVREPVTVLVYE